MRNRIVWILCLLSGFWVSLQAQPGLIWDTGLKLGAAVPVLTFDSQIPLQSRSAPGFRLHSGLALALNEQLDLGLSLGLARYEVDLSLEDYVVVRNISAGNSSYTLDDPTQPLAYELRQHILSQNEQVSIMMLELPLLLRWKQERFYLEAGPVFSFGFDHQYQGSSVVEYEGAFSDLGLVLNNTGFGFQQVEIPQEKGTFANSSLAVGGHIGAGLLLPLNPSTRLSLGLAYRLSSGLNVSPSESILNQRLEGSFAYSSLVGITDKFRMDLPSVQVGLVKSLRSPASRQRNKELPSEPECLPSERERIPVVYRQNLGSRRDPGRNDLEFDLIMDQEKAQIRFPHTEWNPANNILSFCIFEVEMANIRSEFPADHADLEALNSRLVEEVFELEFKPKFRKIPFSFSIADERGKRIEHAFARLYVNEKLLWSDSVQTFNQLIDLYDHPDLSYRLELESPCFESLIKELGQTGKLNLPLNFRMKELVEREPMAIPISGPDSMVMEGMLLKGSLTLKSKSTPVQGWVKEGSLHLLLPCGEKERTFLLTLQKPPGMDLYLSELTANPDEAKLSVPVVKGKALAPISARQMNSNPWTRYHLVYLDLSEVQNLYGIQLKLKKEFEQILDQGDSLRVFLSQGDSPILMHQNQECLSMLIQIANGTPDVPLAAFDREQMLRQWDLIRLAQEEKLTLHFFLSPTLHRLSMGPLIGQLMDQLGEKGREARLEIWMEDLPAQNQRLQLPNQGQPVLYRAF